MENPCGMRKSVPNQVAAPPVHNWRTTDEDEINRRRLRARTESFVIHNSDPAHPIFSNFRVKSGSGLTYSVEVRDVRQRQFACECVDFRINGLGTCKHVEAVLCSTWKRASSAFSGPPPLTALAGWTSCPTLTHDSLRLSNGHLPPPLPCATGSARTDCWPKARPKRCCRN